MIINKKSMKCQLFSERISIWLQRNQRKFLKLENKHAERHLDSEDAVQIISIFKEYVALINNSLEESKEAPANELSDLNEGVKNKTNFRVRASDDKNE